MKKLVIVLTLFLVNTNLLLATSVDYRKLINEGKILLYSGENEINPFQNSMTEIDIRQNFKMKIIYDSADFATNEKDSINEIIQFFTFSNNEFDYCPQCVFDEKNKILPTNVINENVITLTFDDFIKNYYSKMDEARNYIIKLSFIINKEAPTYIKLSDFLLNKAKTGLKECTAYFEKGAGKLILNQNTINDIEGYAYKFYFKNSYDTFTKTCSIIYNNLNKNVFELNSQEFIFDLSRFKPNIEEFAVNLEFDIVINLAFNDINIYQIVYHIKQQNLRQLPVIKNFTLICNDENVDISSMSNIIYNCNLSDRFELVLERAEDIQVPQTNFNLKLFAWAEVDFKVETYFKIDEDFLTKYSTQILEQIDFTIDQDKQFFDLGGLSKWTDNLSLNKKLVDELNKTNKVIIMGFICVGDKFSNPYYKDCSFRLEMSNNALINNVDKVKIELADNTNIPTQRNGMYEVKSSSLFLIKNIEIDGEFLGSFMSNSNLILCDKYNNDLPFSNNTWKIPQPSKTAPENIILKLMFNKNGQKYFIKDIELKFAPIEPMPILYLYATSTKVGNDSIKFVSDKTATKDDRATFDYYATLSFMKKELNEKLEEFILFPDYRVIIMTDDGQEILNELAITLTQLKLFLNAPKNRKSWTTYILQITKISTDESLFVEYRFRNEEGKWEYSVNNTSTNLPYIKSYSKISPPIVTFCWNFKLVPLDKTRRLWADLIFQPSIEIQLPHTVVEDKNDNGNISEINQLQYTGFGIRNTMIFGLFTISGGVTFGEAKTGLYWSIGIDPIVAVKGIKSIDRYKW